jgi:hypothetical protein
MLGFLHESLAIAAGVSARNIFRSTTAPLRKYNSVLAWSKASQVTTSLSSTSSMSTGELSFHFIDCLLDLRPVDTPNRGTDQVA